MNLTTLYLLLCIIFAGRGDERWKKRTREKSYIVEAIDESTEMDQDLTDYEDNFNVNTQNKFDSNVNYKLPKHKKHLKRMYSTQLEKNKKSILDNVLSNSLYTSDNRLHNISKDMTMDIKLNNSEGNDKAVPKWPKFEDLLLSLGVEYDFKSDRWIKLKGGKVQKIPDETVKHFNTDPNHQKHEFKYRTIRINGSKKRKNIIIALTAIR